ncbi:hypothetical protein GWK47_016335 [Chionoecetes opilio]|uniref:Apolipoprotein C-I n=1 Tax=Chionoecetes opilio TaxID=41210 RepID=A0A8J4XRT0_CHIOP|nr:hypothetical protein GWK47_016335 [Chionoecetes opilio]
MFAYVEVCHVKMRVSWMIGAVVLVVTAALVHAGPLNDEQEPSGGSKTLHAIRNFFSPVTSYFSSVPSKTPSDIADDVKGSVADVRDWAKDNEAIQTLQGALNPVRNWIKEKADVVKDQTFSDMYESVKTSVRDLDQRFGTWMEDKIAK